jgi:hypothetical protein
MEATDETVRGGVPKKARKIEQRICKACGKPFYPIGIDGKFSNRMYCSDPVCERRRDAEQRKRRPERHRCVNCKKVKPVGNMRQVNALFSRFDKSWVCNSCYARAPHKYEELEDD